MEHFRHVHVHILAKPSHLPEELKGGKSFALLKVTPEEAAPPEEIVSFCELLRSTFVYTPKV